MYLLVLLFSILTLDTLPLFASISFTNQAAAGVALPGASNGAAFGDYDEDGQPDLLVLPLDENEPVRLYRNQGDGRFAESSQTLFAAGRTSGAGFVDYDSDGDLDIYVVYFLKPNQLLRNDSGTFTALVLPDSLRESPGAAGAALGDFDGDGFVDLFTANRLFIANQFYTRMYTRGFAEQSRLISSLSSGRDSFAAVPFDYDNDGDLDLYIANMGHHNLLHRNDGRGVFRQVAELFAVDRLGASLAAFAADYDNDGDLDLYMINIRDEPNILYRNDSGERFAAVTAAAGLEQSRSSQGAAWADFDNDGHLDLAVSNDGPPAIYRNNGDGTFADLTATALQNIDLPMDMITGGMAAADYDLDGDIDLFLAGNNVPDMLLRNDSADQGHWLGVRLQARGSGQTAIGTRITVRTPSAMQMREYAIAIAAGTAYGDLLHFGLGPHAQVDEMVVQWPSGQRQILMDVAADQVFTLKEPLPQTDLRIRAVVRPILAPGWEALSPEVEVHNAGQGRTAETVLQAQIMYGGRSVYSASRSISELVAGASETVHFPSWTPEFAGAHEFSFALQADDDLPANNTWKRTHHFHLFKEVAPELGVDDPGVGWAGAFADYDNDGDLDLYVSNGGSFGGGDNVLYRNDRDRGFADATVESGAADGGNGTGLAFADFDGDGFQDLFIAKGGFSDFGEANRLFHNDGDGTFSDISAPAGLDIQQSSYGVAVGDYDRDGYLDLFVSQLIGQANALYHNEGDGTFANESGAKNIVSSTNFGDSSSAFADYDGDGNLDLYAGIFGGADIFYAGAEDSAFKVSPVGNRGDAMGLTLGDYDNDGDLDVYVVNRDWRSVLYRNNGELQLQDVAAASGTDNLEPGSGCAFGDYDNDGDLDLFVVNAQRADRVYMNQGDGTFVDMAPALGMADSAQALSVMLGDNDNDGDLDVYVVNEGSANRLYQNGGSPHTWMQVNLRGVQSNIDGIGARLHMFSGSQVQMREVNGAAGFSHSSRTAHFGIGSSARADSLVVRWPNGQVDRHLDIAAGNALQLTEGQIPTAIEEATAPLPRRFVLEQNYPNPFNSGTVIRFALPQNWHVDLDLYNLTGQQVSTLVDGRCQAGRYAVRWDGRDDQGRTMASGVYLYRLQAGAQVETRKLLLVR